MIKKLKILIILVLLVYQSISQTATVNKDSITISKHVASLIAKDLERGDKCAEILTKTNDKLTETQAKVIVKDSIIKYYQFNENSYRKDSISYLQKDSSRVAENQIEKHIAIKYKRQRNVVGGAGILVTLYAIYESFKSLILH